ncbi:MAG: hypothetical protein LBU88_05900 [Treponema sp.]|nr:hypothetical protein [Treponema sp.]
MKKIFLIVLILFVAGISVVAGQSTQPQTLTQGQVFTATMTPGAVHTYRIQLRGDAEYFIAWDDYDTNSDLVDIIVGVRGDNWGQYLIGMQDSGNAGRNLHRMVNRNHRSNKRNPLNIQSGEGGQAEFSPNTEHIIEVRGYNDSSSGTYRIVFY